MPHLPINHYGDQLKQLDFPIITDDTTPIMN